MELDASQPWEIDLLREFCCSDGSLEDVRWFWELDRHGH